MRIKRLAFFGTFVLLVVCMGLYLLLDRTLSQDKRKLEIVTGGWVMTDEANSHFYSVIEQLTLGHQWLLDNLNYRPRRIGLHGSADAHDAVLFLRRAAHLRPGSESLLPVRLQTFARLRLRFHMPVASAAQNNYRSKYREQ
ncbi:unnamed protein product, partial [Nesidiocoris tenuis]